MLEVLLPGDERRIYDLCDQIRWGCTIKSIRLLKFSGAESAKTLSIYSEAL